MNEILDFSTAYPEVLVLLGAYRSSEGIAAAEVADVLREYGFKVRLEVMAEAATDLLLDSYQLIICTAPAAQGALPDEEECFIRMLETETPDLSHLAYGIVMAGGSESLSEQEESAFQGILDELGAVEVVDMHRMGGDALTGGLSSIRSWSVDCAASFSQAFAPAEEEAVLY